ncbi:MAG: pentapeptide repeat-containing protein [Rivularia sp. (in: cyanobacteria)]
MLYELYQWHNGAKERKGWEYCFAGCSEFLTLQEAIDFTRVIAEGEYNEDSWKPYYFFAFQEGTDNGDMYVLTIGEEKAAVLSYCPDSMVVTSIEFSSITQMILEKVFWQEGVDFSRANLAGVDLNGFYLRNIRFTGSNFEKANLSNADLEGADFGGANLKNANLYQAKITDTNFTNAIFSNTIMPDGSIRNS